MHFNLIIFDKDQHSIYAIVLQNMFDEPEVSKRIMSKRDAST